LDDGLGNGTGGNGYMQGWIRLVLTIASIVGGLLWGVAEIKSDIRDNRTYFVGEIKGVNQQIDQLDRRLERIERRGR
jgi:hypothetical protein